jgi:hypothetical protein
MMEILSEQEALYTLERHLTPFAGVMEGGWTDYRTLYSDKLRGIHTPTARAILVHDHQIERASRYADQAKGVRIAPVEKLRLLVVDDKFSIRLKKLDDGLMPSNWLTGQVKDFRRQHQLPGLPPTYNLELGYVLDKSETAIRLVCLTYPNGEYRNFWGIDLTARESVKHQHVFDFAKPVETDREEEEGVVVVPKGDVVPIKRDRGEN